MKRQNIRKNISHLHTFIENRGEGEQDVTHNAVVGFVDGKSRLKVSDYHYCYSTLKNAGHREAIFLQVQDKPEEVLSDEAMFHYYEWLLNWSPYRSTFVNKNASRVMRDKVLVLDMDADAYIISGGAIASRQPYEHHTSKYIYPLRTSIWWDFVKSGVSPDESFILSSFFYPKTASDLNEINSLYFDLHYGGHDAMDKCDSTFINFLNNKPRLLGKSYSYYGGYINHRSNRLFNPNGHENTNISKRLNKLFSSLNNEKKNNNIFDVSSATTYVPRELVVEAAKDFSSILQEQVKAYG